MSKILIEKFNHFLFGTHPRWAHLYLTANKDQFTDIFNLKDDDWNYFNDVVFSNLKWKIVEKKGDYNDDVLYSNAELEIIKSKVIRRLKCHIITK